MRRRGVGAVIVVFATSVSCLNVALARTRPATAMHRRSSAVAMDAASTKADLLSAVARFRAEQEALWERQRTNESSGPLGAQSLANIDLTDESLTASRAHVISCIESLATHNPTPTPLEGWCTDAGCSLEGKWSLLFTTGADATFKPTDRGAPVTFQTIDTRKGLFVNCVDFVGDGDAPAKKRPSKLKGFRVVVAGQRLNDFEVQLFFKRVKLLRPTSRNPLLRTVVIPLPPSWFQRWVARRAARRKAKGGELSARGAGFSILYLDDSLRMHRTFDGQYFVQERKAAEYE